MLWRVSIEPTCIALSREYGLAGADDVTSFESDNQVPDPKKMAG